MNYLKDLIKTKDTSWNNQWNNHAIFDELSSFYFSNKKLQNEENQSKTYNENTLFKFLL